MDSTVQLHRLLLFSLGGGMYAAHVSFIREIVPDQQKIPLPNAPDFIPGDRTIEEDEKEEVLEKIIEEMYLIRLLHLNDLLKESEAGLVLAKTIEPNEAVLTVFADEIPMIPDEILSKHDITATITAGDDEE